jgi:hypothetical protein
MAMKLKKKKTSLAILSQFSMEITTLTFPANSIKRGLFLRTKKTF